MIDIKGTSGQTIVPERPLTILLTNDDGMNAPGIRCLYEAFVGDTVIITVAPQSEQSGIGHAFTFNKPLHYEVTPAHTIPDGYVVSGTPVDCVKFAISHLLKNKRPDAVVSGLNIGENSGLSAFYSGTVAAAREGAFWNIPSFAFSLCEEGKRYRDEYARLAPKIMQMIIDAEYVKKSPNNKIFYNINFPTCSPLRAKGIKVTQQSLAFFDDRYERIEVASHHSGEGFVICGEKIDIEQSNEFDSRALMNGYITITPLHYDATAHDAVAPLKGIEKIDLKVR
jgi:5'-nucleotidase